MFQHPILLGEVVAQLITDQHTINTCRSRKNLAFGQIAPFSLLMITSMTGYPLPVFMECGRYITPPGRSHMDRLSIAHDLIDTVGYSKYLIVVGTHTIGHQFLVDTNHVPMTHL